MTRNLKALGLALIAVFAMSAVVASAAQATPLKVTTNEKAWLTAESKGVQKFTVGGTATLSCATISGHATVAPNDTSITFTEVGYSNCTAEIGATKAFATVNMKGCDYKFHDGSKDPKDANHFTAGEVDLFCEEGTTGPEIEVFSDSAHKTKICTYVVWKTNNYKEITYTNTTTGSPDDVDLVADVAVDSKKTQGILCPESVKGLATYEGEVTIRAYEDLGVSGGKPVEGSQINLTVSE